MKKLVEPPMLGDSVAIRAIRRIFERMPRAFKQMILVIFIAMYNGDICYRKPHSENNIRLRLSDILVHLIPAGLKPDLSNLLEATQKAIMACSREQYAVRKSILNTSKCIIKPFRNKYPYAEKIIHELSKIKICRIKDPYQPIVTNKQILEVRNSISSSTKLKSYNKSFCPIMLMVLMFTGFRVSEFVNLNLDDIDFERNRIFVQPSKGGKSRWIGINKELKPVLLDYIKAIRPQSQYTKVFLLENGNPLSIDRVEKIFKQLREVTGLENLKPHSLRRLFCTYFAGKGVPLPHLQMALGHSQIAMVMRYCKPDQEEILQQQVNW
jgi:integrase